MQSETFALRFIVFQLTVPTVYARLRFRGNQQVRLGVGRRVVSARATRGLVVGGGAFENLTPCVALEHASHQGLGPVPVKIVKLHLFVHVVGFHHNAPEGERRPADSVGH